MDLPAQAESPTEEVLLARVGTLLRLYDGIIASAPGAVIYLAACCARVSLSPQPQTRCSTCPKTPTVHPIASRESLEQSAPDLLRAATPRL